MSKIPFKKLASAIAVSAAIGGVGVVHAIDQGEPADAWMVPYAQYSIADGTNTLVGITVPSQNLGDLGSFPACSNPQVSGSYNIHWYFFDSFSVHQADGTLSATAEDFVPFDWAGIASVSAGIKAKTDGVFGYLVFTDIDAINGGYSNQCFFADAIWVRGVWESAAYLPGMGLQDTMDDASNRVSITDDVVYSGGEPSQVNPSVTGVIVNDSDGVAETVYWDMRYYLDDSVAPIGSTDLVMWFPTNDGARTNVPIDVYDTGENSGSANVDIPWELNILDAALIGWTDWTQATALPGGINPALSAGPLEGNKQGFVRFDMPELTWIPGVHAVSAGTNTAPAGAVFFSLIGLTSPGNAAQIQTILGHERGIQ